MEGGEKEEERIHCNIPVTSRGRVAGLER